MGDVAVHAAVGQKPHQVECTVPLLAVVHGLDIGLVLKEAAVLNGAADAGQILEHHPAGADVGVPHLGVAHLALGKTHVQPGGGQAAAGVFRKILSRFGVRAAAMALPARSSHTPKPSIMIRVVGVLLIITSNLFFSFQNGDGRGRPCASRCHAAGWAHVRIVKSGLREKYRSRVSPVACFFVCALP